MTSLPAVSHCVFIRARRGRSDALGECLGHLASRTLKVPGCLHCAAQRALHEEDTWLLSAQWASEEASSAWVQAPGADCFSLLARDGLITHIDVQTFGQAVRAAPELRRAG
ncbi:antibiotic biosynthesis monooxygenase family protein [Pseudomonas sp. KNUC1026]|uniref:antibiotic biosynthesis monooxygenase family protein n=1 Tax=Pseudomonas sp. KNUC1026 TaxID=2893890 RepID=UPI001F46C143|nr:antibiotic biosynthesis monooxygenase family protein [Pseudomonas sp. KNUC1026]UFH50035.1 antibiotic biosynthesis monooxygenase [Pseudomonas sp. KNUC1026]